MKNNILISLLCIIGILCFAIVVPPITGNPLDKIDAIFILVSIVLWGFVSIFGYVKEVVDKETEIEDLKRRIKKLEEEKK